MKIDIQEVDKNMLELNKEKTLDLDNNISFKNNIESLTDEEFLSFGQRVITLIENEILFHMNLSEQIKDKYLDMEFNYVESSSYQREKEIEYELSRIKIRIISILTKQNIYLMRNQIIYLFENEIPFEINRMIQNYLIQNNEKKPKEEPKVLKKKVLNKSSN